MEQEIKSEFIENNFSLEDEDEILNKCVAFCINYKLSPSDLVSSWVVYYLNMQLDGSKVQNAHVDGFLHHLQNKQKHNILKEESNVHMYSSNDVNMLLGEEHKDGEEGMLDTPIKQAYFDNLNDLSTPISMDRSPERNGKSISEKSSRRTSSQATPFGQRTNKFLLQLSFNSHSKADDTKDLEIDALGDDVIRRVQDIESCSLQVQGSWPKPGFRFMYDKVEDRFNALENRIRRLSSALVASGECGEPSDATLASQKTLFSVGMVCCDGEGRLNDKSILFQGSVEHSGGQRVRLDLKNLVQFSLFPGQVIGIEGHNPSGHCFIASKLVDSFPLSGSSDVDLPPAKKQATDQNGEPATKASRELSIVIAAGPLSTTDNLLFEPLTELLAYARRKQPQLLILMGPFVDTEHPKIKKGTIDESFAEVFQEEILNKLHDYCAHMGPAARIVLVPSTRDAHNDFVFPQPPFEIYPSTDPDQQITCLANPGVLISNEITIGCCTADVLKQLSGEEVSRMSTDALSIDRIGRLVSHVIKQRCFYPVYPPSVGLPLDFSIAPEALHMASIPDLLLMPSDLAPFIKALPFGEGGDTEKYSRCLCINPGRLAKGVSGGTFVELSYLNNPDQTSASIIRI
ncbi:hypothetical protein AMTRI_Chr06g177850 [Amborella trichopoda]